MLQITQCSEIRLDFLSPLTQWEIPTAMALLTPWTTQNGKVTMALVTILIRLQSQNRYQ